MYGCESWTIKKAECRRIDAFELCCWRRLLRIPCTARRSNQSILKEISPEYSLEGLMKLKLQCFGHLRWRTDSLEKTLMVGKTDGGRIRGLQRMRWLDGIINGREFEQALGVGDGQGSLVCSPWHCKELDTNWCDWTELNVEHFKVKRKSLSLVRLFVTPWTTVHGILQARILELVAFPFPRGSAQSRDWTQVSCVEGGFFTSWATREAQEYYNG